MALWKPSLLMSIYNVHLTSVRVKDKACICNDLRLTRGIDCIAGFFATDKERLRFAGGCGPSHIATRSL